MKRFMLTIAGVTALLAGPVAAQAPVGVNATVENSVRTRSQGEDAWRASVVNGTVRQADAILTGADSRLGITFRDQSVLTVGANASLTVDRFVIDTERDAAGVLVSMVQGAFRFVSGSRGAEPERVAFRTPTATIGIRGTIIEAAVGAEAIELLGGEAEAFETGTDPEEAAVVILIEGEIEVEADGVRRIVREPGRAVRISGRRLSEPFRLSPDAGRRLEARLPRREGGDAGRPVRGPDRQGRQGADNPPRERSGQGQTPQRQSGGATQPRSAPDRPGASAPAGNTPR